MENFQKEIADFLNKGRLLTTINIPVQQFQFVLKLNLPNAVSKPIFLSYYEFPQLGLGFSQSAESMYFQIPTVIHNSMTIKGYIYSDVSSDIWDLYMSQFDNGLLGFASGYNFDLYHMAEGKEDAFPILTNVLNIQNAKLGCPNIRISVDSTDFCEISTILYYTKYSLLDEAANTFFGSIWAKNSRIKSTWV